MIFFTVNHLYSKIKFNDKYVVYNLTQELRSDLIVSKFELQLLSYVQFWTNTLGKSMSPLIPQICVK